MAAMSATVARSSRAIDATFDGSAVDSAARSSSSFSRSTSSLDGAGFFLLAITDPTG